MNSNKTTTFASLVSRFVGEKIEKLLFSENPGFLGYKMRLFDRICGAKGGPTYKKRRHTSELV